MDSASQKAIEDPETDENDEEGTGTPNDEENDSEGLTEAPRETWPPLLETKRQDQHPNWMQAFVLPTQNHLVKDK